MRFSHPLLLVAPVILALSACSSTTSRIKENLAFLGVNYKAYSQVSEASFRGQLNYDGDQAYFKSCDSEIEYEISDNEELYDIYDTIIDAQDEEDPVYIEFSGEVNFPDHYNSDSPIVIDVERVHHMAAKKISLQCAKAIDTFDFKAKGNDPYWRINAHEQTLFFANKASNESYQLDKIELSTSSVNYLKGVNDKGEQLFLEITPEHCYMLDNQEYWGFRTQINSIYGEFNGCGESGHLSNVALFKGEYVNQSQAIKLTLKQDHTLKYQQTTDGQLSEKTGFWKSNTEETVVLMLTNENTKTIQEELILTRDGDKLVTHQVNQDNAITEFDQALVFEKQDAQQTDLDDQHNIQIKRQFTAELINPEQSIDLEVKAALKKYFKIHRTDPKETQFNSVRFDLNGDGRDDAIALLDWCAGDQCEMIIFEATDDGLNFSSRVSRIQAPIIVSENRHFSWQSLMVESDNSCFLLDFDGLSYPLHIRDAVDIKKIENSSEVTLFSSGKPAHWFLIK